MLAVLLEGVSTLSGRGSGANSDGGHCGAQ